MTIALNANHTVKPPDDPEALRGLERFLDHLSEPAALLGPDGQTIPLPMETFELLRNVVTTMRMGKAITIAPVDQLLSTQEAADFLGLSRPTLVRLLEGGRIPYEFSSGGRHRRVRLDDLLEYRAQQQVNRGVALDELTGLASAQGLYDETPETYRAALAAARRAGETGD